MCGRFAQYSSRDDYFHSLGLTSDEVTFDPTPIGRFNVSPGTKVLLLNDRNDALHLDPVYWGYGPEWWDKSPLINARGETASSSRMFKPLWEHGRAVVPADGWFEWKKKGSKKQPYFIHHQKNQPLFFAAIGRSPFNKMHDKEGFVIVTSSSDQGMVDIHDRRPLVLSAVAVREWLSPDTSAERAQEIARNAAVAEKDFTWHPVTHLVGNIKNQGEDLIAEVTDAEF